MTYMLTTVSDHFVKRSPGLPKRCTSRSAEGIPLVSSVMRVFPSAGCLDRTMSRLCGSFLAAALPALCSPHNNLVNPLTGFSRKLCGELRFFAASIAVSIAASGCRFWLPFCTTFQSVPNCSCRFTDSPFTTHGGLNEGLRFLSVSICVHLCPSVDGNLLHFSPFLAWR